MFTVIEYLRKRLEQPLPGWAAHQLMAPPARRDLTAEMYEERKKTARLGSVLVLFYPVNNVLHLALMQRPEYDGTHSGQVSFPGGKMEEFDKDYVATALREANEEVNINPDDVDVLGQLTDIYIPPSNFLVFPVVGFIDKRPNFIPEEREVVEVIELPVSELLKEENLGESSILMNKIFRFNSPAFTFDSRIVWGATAMMLAELRAILREAEADNLL